MHPLLTLTSLVTLAGVVAFIEIALQLFIKPALEPWEEERWYGLVLNVVALLVGFSGAAVAAWGAGAVLTAQQLVAIFFRALEAAAISIYGFEIAKHAKEMLKRGGK